MKSSQDIDSVTLAAEIVKVMNAKIVAKINQEGSDIHCNRTVILYKLYSITNTRKIRRFDYYLRPDTVRPTDPIFYSLNHS